MAFPAAGAVVGAIFGTKAVKISALIASMTALTAALAVTMGNLFNDLQKTLPPEFALGLGLMPSNTTVCLSSVLVAAVARWIYDTHSRILLSVTS